MVVEDVADTLRGFQQSSYEGIETLIGRLTLDEAYAVQFELLRRKLAEGERLAGWKIGGNSAAARSAFGITEPIYGHLLAAGRQAPDRPLSFFALHDPVIEIELAFTIGQRLAGPGVDRSAVLDAIESVHPAAEIAERRTPAGDLPLLVADNVAQWGYVVGQGLAPVLRDIDLQAEAVEIAVNGAFRERLLGKEVIDEQIGSMANLANHLAKYGFALEPGQIVITGSCNRPAPVQRDETWTARFSTFGQIGVQFS